ncbi:MAG: hypothetical protein C0176_04945 [Mesoaciditoga sp.]|uniref:hypothetical protein n=1 Tax=Athalassotoga sp. TaxID=2022597 RepID=UPI000CC3E82C|nr:MAG: hypothetical protein C0185_03295 [Mesoaciditoga sp.]PMP79633.1 MAG: hypothetical protein C0176_04945 [Mesoaciditoga sp.]HEU23603.1 hypothetical protein [Mesoaciditoga lauensis]
MKLILFLILIPVLAISSFAITSVNGSVGLQSNGYDVGLTFKSIGTMGFELTVEGTVNNLMDLSQIGNISKWYLYPTLLVSLPTGEIRPYAGLGIMTTFSPNSGFGPVSFSPLYYHVGVDMFFGAFSAFGEGQGIYNIASSIISFSNIKEWRFGVGLAF